MENSKHTKGNWFIQQNKETELKEIFIKSDIGNSAICILYKNNKTVKTEDEAMENAKLIASAPELLEALVNVQKMLSKWEENDQESFNKNIDIDTHIALEKTLKKVTE